MGKVLRCRFVPQAWINDYAVEVDPEGPTEWTVPWGDDPVPESGTYESDALRYQGDAPAWIMEWGGPFRVEVLPE